MKVDWKPGPPTEPGVYCVYEKKYNAVSYAHWTYLDCKDPGNVTHHAPAELPDPPREKPEPGCYVAKWVDDEEWGVYVVRVHAHYDCPTMLDDGCSAYPWTEYEFGDRIDLPEGW